MVMLTLNSTNHNHHQTNPSHNHRPGQPRLRSSRKASKAEPAASALCILSSADVNVADVGAGVPQLIDLEGTTSVLL